MSSMSCSQCEPPTKVLIADRNRMASQLLAESLGRNSQFEAVGVTSPIETLSAVSARRPNVAVISADFDGDPRRGLQITRAINAHYHDIHIVSLLELSAPDPVVAAFRCGAKGVFCRSSPLSEFRACVERVSRGEIWAGSTEAEYLLAAMRSAPSCDGVDNDKVGMLSKREAQVAERAAQGFSNRQVADQLRLSEHTVKNYLSHVFEKLGVSNRVELLFLLLKEGQGSSGAVGLKASGLGNSPEVYLRAAEEGYAAAQLVVGLAHLDGHGMEKNGHSAYYWLRMAEENSSAVRQRSRALINDLRARIDPGEIEELEGRIATAAQKDKVLVSEPADLFKQHWPLLADRKAS